MFGHLLIVLAGSGLGMYYAHRLTRRLIYLRQCVRLMRALGQQVTFTALPMTDLWLRLAAREVFADYALLQDTVSGLTDKDFTAAFTTAVEGAVASGVLESPGRQLLLEFLEGCGRYDLTGETTHIAQYGDRLADLEVEMAQRTLALGRVYRVMGMAGGVALALLLL